MIERAQEGDREAFRSPARSYWRRTYALASHYARDRREAEDLSQEVWLKAGRAIGGFRGKGVDSMKEERKKTNEEELTRRHFPKGGAGAVLVASCLPALGMGSSACRVRRS